MHEGLFWYFCCTGFGALFVGLVDATVDLQNWVAAASAAATSLGLFSFGSCCNPLPKAIATTTTTSTDDADLSANLKSHHKR